LSDFGLAQLFVALEDLVLSLDGDQIRKIAIRGMRRSAMLATMQPEAIPDSSSPPSGQSVQLTFSP